MTDHSGDANEMICGNCKWWIWFKESCDLLKENIIRDTKGFRPRNHRACKHFEPREE